MARILVVDDNAQPRIELHTILVGLAHTVLFAPDGEVALSIYDQAEPDLVPAVDPDTIRNWETNRSGIAPCARPRHIAALLLLLMSQPAVALGQGSPSDSRSPEFRSSLVYPALSKTRELTLLGVGGALFLASSLLQTPDLRVPPQGFDPSEIAWAIDRGVVGNRDSRAAAASGWTTGLAVLFPVATGLAAQSGAGWSGLTHRSLVYGEAYLIAQGITVLGKDIFSRPRPYTYRPGGFAEDLADARTFQSMPSGHSVTAWTGAVVGMTEHLLHRPDATSVERVGVALLGGALASSTSALRVRAGEHFPSDVIVGAGIGIATGIAIPLLHRGDQPLPTSRAWLEMAGGALGGTILGILVSQAY